MMVISMKRLEGGARFLGKKDQPPFLLYKGNPEPCSQMELIKGVD